MKHAVQARDLNDGEFVYRLGDQTDAVYSVVSGFIIVRRPNPAGGSREQLLGPGAVFGAADMLGGGTRSADARAHGPATVAVHMPDQVVDAILDRPEAVDAMVASVLAAARAAEEEEEPPEADAPHTIQSIQLIPLDPKVIGQLGRTPLVIDEFPFVIGRKSDGQRSGLALPVSLSLVDKPPFSLSRRHFSIDYEDGRFVVRDCRSYHGTIVNGRALGAGGSAYFAELAPGRNEIIAGAEKSPFRFSCIVPVSSAA